MGVTLTLYKPVKTGYIPGEIDTMTDAEFENAVRNNIDITNGKYTDGKDHYAFTVTNYLTTTKKDRRNNYSRKCIDILLNRYCDYMIDQYTWLNPNKTKTKQDKYLSRYFIPTDIIFGTKISAVKKFYKQTCTNRYAFTKKDAAKLMNEYINTDKNLCKYQIINNVLDMWEDNMFLCISW